MRTNFFRPKMLGFCSTLMFASVFLQGAKSAAEALDLYNKGQYVQSANAFEAVVTSGPPNARAFYYAALANRASNRAGRAKQLCTYIVANFADAPEAALAKQMLDTLEQPAIVKSTALTVRHAALERGAGSGLAASAAGLGADEPGASSSGSWHTGAAARKKMAFVFYGGRDSP